MISACGYLGDDGVACTLHGRKRADGRPAKPDLCIEWPPKNQGFIQDAFLNLARSLDARNPA